MIHGVGLQQQKKRKIGWISPPPRLDFLSSLTSEPKRKKNTQTDRVRMQSDKVEPPNRISSLQSKNPFPAAAPIIHQERRFVTSSPNREPDFPLWVYLAFSHRKCRWGTFINSSKQELSASPRWKKNKSFHPSFPFISIDLSAMMSSRASPRSAATCSAPLPLGG